MKYENANLKVPKRENQRAPKSAIMKAPKRSRILIQKFGTACLGLVMYIWMVQIHSVIAPTWPVEFYPSEQYIFVFLYASNQ